MEYLVSHSFAGGGLGLVFLEYWAHTAALFAGLAGVEVTWTWVCEAVFLTDFFEECRALAWCCCCFYYKISPYLSPTSCGERTGPPRQRSAKTDLEQAVATCLSSRLSLSYLLTRAPSQIDSRHGTSDTLVQPGVR